MVKVVKAGAVLAEIPRCPWTREKQKNIPVALTCRGSYSKGVCTSLGCRADAGKRVSHSSWPCVSLQRQEEVTPPLMGCGVELVIERCCFFAFLLPGINKSHILGYVRNAWFFSGTTGEQNGGEPNYGYLQGLTTTIILLNPTGLQHLAHTCCCAAPFAPSPFSSPFL